MSNIHHLNIKGAGDSSTFSQNQVGDGGGGGGGNMDDILKRLHTVEQTVSEIRADVVGLKTSIPHLATKADVASIPLLATKADVANLETSLIKWFVVTAIALAVLAFTIARYVAPA